MGKFAAVAFVFIVGLTVIENVYTHSGKGQRATSTTMRPPGVMCQTAKGQGQGVGKTCNCNIDHVVGTCPVGNGKKSCHICCKEISDQQSCCDREDRGGVSPEFTCTDNNIRVCKNTIAAC